MATGLAGGLAEGLQSGIALESGIKQQQFERGLQSRYADMASQEQGIRVDQESRSKARDALTAIGQQKDDLSRQLFVASQHGDTSGVQAFRQQMSDLHGAEQDAYKHLGGPELHDFVTGAQQTADDLHTGRKTVSDLSPQELTNTVVHATGRPVADLLDTSQGPSKVGQQLQAFHQGVANLQKDSGKSLLDATNDLYGQELHGLVGQHGYDGSVVTGAEFAPPVPHPNSPGNMSLMAHITYRSPDGRTGEQYVPVMDDHGQILAHPDDKSDATVKNFHINDLFNHVGALESMYKAVNSDPDARGKLQDGFLEGHDDKAAQMLDWMHVLGHDPSEYMPKSHVLVDPTNGNVLQRFGANEEITVAPKGFDPAHEALFAAEVANLGRGLTPTGRDPNMPTVMPVVINGPQGQSIVPFQTHGPHPGMSADGMTPPMRSDGTAPQAGDASDTGGMQIPPLGGGGQVPTLPTAGAGGAIQLPRGTTASRLGGGAGTGAARSPAAAWAAMWRAKNPDATPEEFAEAAATFGAQLKAKKDFSTGQQGNSVRSFNVALSHLDTLGHLADALDNGNVPLFNRLGNAFATQTGKVAPNNFNSAKQIVAEEIIKAVTGSAGALGDRETAEKSINGAGSPAQLRGVIDTYKKLMNGQLQGLRRQYQQSTGRDDFDSLLSDEAKSELGVGSHPATNAKGWSLHQDKSGNFAYVSPDNKQFEEVK